MKTPESDYVFAKVYDGSHCEVHSEIIVLWKMRNDCKVDSIPSIRIENVYKRNYFEIKFSIFRKFTQWLEQRNVVIVRFRYNNTWAEEYLRNNIGINDEHSAHSKNYYF